MLIMLHQCTAEGGDLSHQPIRMIHLLCIVHVINNTADHISPSV